MIIAIILSSLALLAATACLVLTIRERKRSQKRNAALVRYTEQVIQDALSKATEATGALKKEYSRRIEDLEKGIVPDFEKAKAAATAVNDFNAGITSIMGFDPFEALRAQRDGNSGGDRG